MKITFSLVAYIIFTIFFAWLAYAHDTNGNTKYAAIALVLSMLMGYITGQELRFCRDAYKEQRRLEMGGPLDNPHNF